MSEHYRQLVADVALEHAHSVHRGWEQEFLQALERVPMAMPPKAAADLRDLLMRMLEWHGDGVGRLQILHQVQRMAQPLLDGLYRQIMAESHPLPAAKAELAARVLVLRSLQARNTCMAVWELANTDGSLPLLGRRRIMQTVNQGMLLTRDVLELSFLQYQEPPRGTWHRLHALFGFARDSGLSERKCALAGEEGKSTARQRYAQSLLLAMANPWGLQRSELVQAQSISRALADGVRFDPQGDWLAAGLTGGDSGPGFAGEVADVPAAALRFDPVPALEMLEQQLSWSDKDAAMVTLGDGHGRQIEVRRSMLERVLRAWKGQAQREFDRVGARHVMSVLVGMSAVHQAMAGGEDFETFRERLAGGDTEASVTGNAAAWLSGHSAAGPVHLEARVLDQSLGGYRLQWPSGHGHRVRIGELVGLMPGSLQAAQAEQHEAVMMLGVLRWLRTIGQAELAVGVELLSRQPRPAVVRGIDRQGKRGPLRRGLLLDQDGATVELLMANIREQPLSAVEVSCAEDEMSGQSVAMHRRRFTIGDARELSPSYYRVSLSDSGQNETQAQQHD